MKKIKKKVKLTQQERLRFIKANCFLKNKQKRDKGRKRRCDKVKKRLNEEGKTRRAWDRYWNGLEYEQQQKKENMTEEERQDEIDELKYFVDDFKYAHNYETGFDRYWTELPFMKVKTRRSARQKKNWYRSHRYKFFKNFEYLQFIKIKKCFKLSKK